MRLALASFLFLLFSACNPLGNQTTSPDFLKTELASLSISDGASYSFGNRAVNASVDKVFTLSNSGARAATGITGAGLAAPYTFKGGSFPGTGGSCSTTLGAYASCTIVVRFTPTSPGSATDTLEITYDDGSDSQTVERELTGTGVALGSLTISDANYDYGTKYIGTNTDKTFTITNAGAGTVTSMGEGSPALAGVFFFKGGTYPGTGGTCASTLAASATCTIVVTFSPTAAASFTDTIQIAYSDSQASQSATRLIAGAGQAAASITISDGSTYNYGNVTANTTVDKAFTVSNDGDVSATSLAIGTPALAAPFAYKGGTYPGTGGDCSTSLGVASACTIVVTYSPVTSGVSSDTIRLDYNDGLAAQTATRDITGTALSNATLTLSESDPYNYGTQAVNSDTDKTFTVTHSGGVNATSMAEGAAALAAPFAFKGGTYPGTGGTCSTSLSIGDTCTIVVTFSPTAAAASSDTINISYNNGASTQTASRDVSGTGQALASLSISDGPTYAFGVKAVNSSTDKTFTVTNDGLSGATLMTAGTPALAAPFSFKGGTYPGTGGDCGATLAASDDCTIVVTYNPTTAGASSGTVRVQYNDGTATQTATVGVTGSTVASLTISDANTYDFGIKANNSSTDKEFTITNEGGSTASSMAAGAPAMSAPYGFKGGSYPGTGGTCSTTLAASGTCTVVVTFAPTSTGVASDTLRVGYDDGTGAQTATRPMTGNGQDLASLTISDGTTYNFNGVNSGSSADKTFTITNVGGVTATSMASGAAMSAPFGFKGGSYPGTGGTCSTSLTSTSTCTVVVTFAPSSTGSFTDTLRIAYNDSSAAQTSTRDLAGIGVSIGLLDTTLDSDGVATSGDSSTNLTIRAMRIRTNGKIVVGGSYASGSTSDFLLAQFNNDGSLDTAFGTSGIVRTAIGSGTNDDAAFGMELDSNNKVYLSGRTKSGTVYNWAVARYLSSGVLDTTFNSAGTLPGTNVLTTANLGGDSGATSEARGLTLTTDGRVLVSGFVVKTVSSKVRNNFAVARFTTAGTIDTTFNSASGYQVISLGSNAASGTAGDIAHNVLVDTANGGVVVLGGQADVGSGGSTKLNFGLVRLPPNGGTSGGSGYATTTAVFANGNATDIGNSMSIDSNNRIVMGGYTGSTKQFGVMRFQSGSTSLDTTFNSAASGSNAGTFKFAIGATSDEATKVVIDSSNRIVLAGKSNNGTSFDFAVARVSTSGTLDTTFDGDGKMTISLNAGDDMANALRLDTLGRIVMGGTTVVGGYTDMALVRLWP